ncbi:Ldh family oxidoreductase [Reyranella sp. CPCC 100927]|uniref:Ldh family oxidoreductase n=1 Tax=Reyranella sp. CPCC 100927 TaxID=2599616 RepID=UPI0011B62FB7|nr:Ldh family oxidoreductase [Reyranella sp. CPCC 100927]TWT12969.1 Ldh family oxidoreductase [Reyranella sp. CPCC 100927]
MLYVPVEQLRRQCVEVLQAWGMSAEHAAITADILAETDLRGVESHGISMLPVYDGMRIKKLNMRPDIRIVRDTPVAALIDADNALGHVPSKMAVDLAIDKAQRMGIAVVTVRRSAHFGAAGCYTDMIARAGLVGIATTSARGIAMVPTFGTEPVFGTNPISVAAPAGRHPPFNLDMATTPVAVNKLKVYWLKGKELPEGWAYDAQGKPERNAERAFQTRRMAPLGGTREAGGHKGYGLAMAVSILSATLAGTPFQPLRIQREGADTPDNIGHFFLAIDPKLFRDEGDFERDLDEMIDHLHGQTPADPAQPVLVPGDPEYAERAARLKSGVPIPETLAAQLKDVCRQSNAAYVLED